MERDYSRKNRLLRPVGPSVRSVARYNGTRPICLYDRHRFEREIAATLALWADYGISIEKWDSNIATLKRA